MDSHRYQETTFQEKGSETTTSKAEGTTNAKTGDLQFKADNSLQVQALKTVQQKANNYLNKKLKSKNGHIDSSVAHDNSPGIQSEQSVQNKTSGSSNLDSAVVQRTFAVNVKRSQVMVEDGPGGNHGGKTFGWESKFDVDIVAGKVVVTIRIESSIPTELFNSVWKPQIDRQWSNRFMVKTGNMEYPIIVNLVQVKGGGHYQVKAIESESVHGAGRAHSVQMWRMK